MADEPPVHFALVVDDDPTVLMLAMAILEDAGFHPLSAATGDKAIETLDVKGESITLLFTDVQMPGSMNGFELARTVARRWPHIGILVSSGNLSPKPGELPESATFVPKPFSAEIVRDRLHEVLPEDRKPRPLLEG